MQDYINSQIAKGNLLRIKNRNIQASESTSPIEADYGMDVPSNNSIRNSNEKVNGRFFLCFKLHSRIQTLCIFYVVTFLLRNKKSPKCNAFGGFCAVKEFAAESGIDWSARVQEMQERYQNVKNADPEKELLADLVGEYLFTDSGFVKSLSTKNPSLFKKIYEEIKYLAKTFAGTKQGAALEKVKNTFAEMYRDVDVKNTAQTDGVKYALSDGTVKNASELSRSDLQYLLESAQNGEMSDNSYIPLRRNTPEFFIGVVEEHSNGTVVVENYPMAVTVEHIRQNMDEEDGQSYGKARPHGFSVDDIITISEKMGDPSYIVLQKNGRYAEVVSFCNKRNKQVVVAIDFADSNPAEPKNYKYSQYMNGYEGGYYNIIVTQFEPDNFAKYLNDNEVVYSKKEMNGRYQVGSGRIVTVTHDTPFIEDIISEPSAGVKEEKAPNAETRDVFGFAVNKNANVNEDLLEELSIHDPNAEVDADGNITVYHRTTAENADSIHRTGIMKAQEDALFFSSKDSGYASDYGDTVVKLKIPSTVLQVNDIFDGEVHFDIPLKYKNGGFQLDVSQYLQNTKEPSLSYSLGGNEQGTAPAVGYRITGEDVALAPTREDIARMEQEQGGLEDVLTEGASIRSQLRNNQEVLNAMQPVAEIQTPAEYAQMDITEKKKWVEEKLRPTGYKVERKGFGIIDFAKKRLKSAFNYFDKNSVEEASFEAIPFVLENGVEIENRNVHKDRNYGTVTIAAPITINGKRGNMAVVVKQTNGNYYKVHRVLTPDGSVFNLPEMTNEAESTPAGESPINGSLATPKDSASVISIPEDVPGVKYSVEELGAPTREDILRMEMERELHGPWRMADPLDQKVEKLYRMMLREKISEEEYNAQLVKADRRYQQRGSRVEDALERIREAYSTHQAVAVDEFEVKQEEVKAVLGEKGAYVSKQANALYDEVKGMQKGKRVSNTLSYLLDTLDLSEANKSESYGNLRTALFLCGLG